MVNRSAYSMVSALHGLQRLESQLNRALLDAGAKPEIGQPKKMDAEDVNFETDKQLARASLVLNEIDLLA